MTRAELENHEHSLHYAQYTYPAVHLSQPEVDKVNSCLLNEMKECLTFRTPTCMIRSIRQWRKHMRELGPGPNLLPPNIMPTFLGMPSQQYLSDIIANLGVEVFSSKWNKYAALEIDLVRAINRTHSDVNEMQTGHVEDPAEQGTWKLAKSDQPSNLSWRRSGRKKMEHA